MPSLYTFTEYSPDWPAQFAAEAERLALLLGDELIEVHHVGSTSVPGLAAKPVIDAVPEVRDITHIDRLTPMLQEAGYKPWGEYGLVGRRFFTKDRGDYRTHNIHIYQTGDESIARHVAFCAYLRCHEAVCREYEAVKRAAYAQHPAEIMAYNDAKDAWIRRLEPVAIEWYAQQTR